MKEALGTAAEKSERLEQKTSDAVAIKADLELLVHHVEKQLEVARQVFGGSIRGTVERKFLFPLSSSHFARGNTVKGKGIAQESPT